MTAAYDDDKISSRREENVKNNSDLPAADYSTPRKIAEIITMERSGDNSEENGAIRNNNELDSGDEKMEELSASHKSVEFKTVNSTSIAGRCVEVQENSTVNNADDENCTSPEEEASSLETCLKMLRKQKNIEEIITDTQETFTCIGVRNSIANTEITRAEKEKEEEEEEVEENFKTTSSLQGKSLIDTKSYGELITNCSELQLSSNTPKMNSIEVKDLNSNLTDENKSRKLINTSRDILIDNETLTVNYYPVENESYHEHNSVRIMNSKEQKSYRGSSGCGNSIAGRIANFELSRDPEIFEDYDPECEISFHEAVRAGDAKSVEILMARGDVQNIDEPDWNVSGDPPLLVAATNHSLPVLRVLLSNGCDPGVRSPRGETALHRAIINGSPSSVFEIVEELLKYDCPSTVKEAGGGLTALHMLTRQLAYAQSSKTLHHNFDIALKTLALLAKVGPVDAKDHQGRSALHLLASSSTFGNSHKIEIEPMIRTLLEAGADPALKNDRGETPLHEALECGALNTAFLLIPHTPVGITSRYGETPLHIAARKNQPEVVDSLLKRGEDPSFQDAGGNTPLHLASARGFHHTVSLLVTSPLAQLEKTNDEGLTSLQVAAESGFVNAVRLLLKAGADPSQTANYCVATLHRHPDITVLINHELTRRRQLAA